eukprot:maker-scaffold180_size281610-snap-gene-1.28 protein:Tk11870 transcript:maker-scaffold180_size281610-snap-gene-1.28-mRNA-1 annotation:"protein c-ets-1-b-like"
MIRPMKTDIDGVTSVTGLMAFCKFPNWVQDLPWTATEFLAIPDQEDTLPVLNQTWLPRYLDAIEGLACPRFCPEPQDPNQIQETEETLEELISKAFNRTEEPGPYPPQVVTEDEEEVEQEDSGTEEEQATIPKAKITTWLDQLLNSRKYNPKVVKWENKEEGLFRVVDQKELARLWGEVKSNKKMNYDKFSRAMRYYYKRQELVIVRRKLVYKFGPRAPMFRNKSTGSSPPTARSGYSKRG